MFDRNDQPVAYAAPFQVQPALPGDLANPRILMAHAMCRQPQLRTSRAHLHVEGYKMVQKQ